MSAESPIPVPLAIIENTKEAREEFGYAWGYGDMIITPEQLEALRHGKVLAIFDGEYVHFISLEAPQ